MGVEYRRGLWKLISFVLIFILFIALAAVVAQNINISSQDKDYDTLYQELQDAKKNYNDLYILYQKAIEDYEEVEQDYQEAYDNYLEAERDYLTALEAYEAAQDKLDKIDENTDLSGHFYTVIDYEINYGGTTYTKYIHTTYSTYFHYRLDFGHPSHSSPDLQIVADIIETYCIVSSGIVTLAQSLKSQCNNPNDDEEVVDALLSFVQHKGDYSRSIKYLLDGTDDFAKYPWETIAEGNGDCEDKTILFGSLSTALGYSTAIFVLPGHVFVGVYLTSSPVHNYQSPTTWSVEINSNQYYTCETTVDGWLIGDLASEYQGEAVCYRIID